MKELAAIRFVLPTVLVLLLAVCMPARILAQAKVAAKDAEQFAGLIIEPDVVAAADVDAWKKEGFHAIILVLYERFDAVVYHRAAKAIATTGLDLYYWIEVGRNPTFAHDHPEWMASLGSHKDWRKRFPDVRQLQDGEVAKAWPWTPIAYREAFDAHAARIKKWDYNRFVSISNKRVSTQPERVIGFPTSVLNASRHCGSNVKPLRLPSFLANRTLSRANTRW